MRRCVSLCGLLIVAGILTAAAPAPETPKRDRAVQIQEQLRSLVNFGGFDDPKTTFQEAKEALEDRYQLTIEVNEAAFRNEQVAEVLSAQIVDRPIPKMREVRLERVLRRLLSRLPGGATFLIRGDVIEITTEAAARMEITGDPERPLPPLVNMAFDKTPLEQALRDVANATELSVVLDPKVGEKSKSPISARFTNSPVDTTVQVLADMAELKMAQLDNVLYVTTKENADRIRGEQEKQAEKNDMPIRRPALRPFVPGTGAGM